MAKNNTQIGADSLRISADQEQAIRDNPRPILLFLLRTLSVGATSCELSEVAMSAKVAKAAK